VSIVSHEIAANGVVVQHSFWRENADGSRQLLMRSTVPVDTSIQWDFPPGSLNVVEATDYEYETDLERETPGYVVLPAEERENRWRWRRKSK
jgi:hypothetical protein